MANIYGLDTETRGLISDELKSSGLKTMASSFADVANSYINYKALNVQAGTYKLQANAIELQAQQQANNLRQQFIGAVGNANYNAAARGVKVSSQNLQQNIERSAGDLDEDVRKMKKNAGMQADNLRTQAKITKRNAKATLVSGILNGVAGASEGYDTYSLGRKIGGSDTEDMSDYESWNPAKSAPARKPKRG